MTRTLRPAALGFVLGFVVALAGACGGTKTCDPGTCASGCCDENGTCQSGSDVSACGTGGASCTACAPGQQCNAGICTTPGGDGGSDGGSGSDYLTWCDELAAATCSRAIRCDQVSASLESSCRAVFKQRCEKDARNYAKGYRTFDSAKAAQCLATAQDAGCTGEIELPCTDVLKPNSGAGQSCLANEDCKDTGTGCGGLGCEKTCTHFGGLYEPCREIGCDPGLYCDETKEPDLCVPKKGPGSACSSPSQCASGTHCDGTTHTCLPNPGAGELCQGESCAVGTYCDFNTSTCRPQVPVGGECTFNSCVDQAFCDFSTSPATCVARRGVGGACVIEDNCQIGLACRQGTCQPRVREGESCQGPSDCENGTSCDSITRTCLRLRIDAAPGESCTDDFVLCEYGSRCVGAEENPDGGVGTLGTCQLRQVGDPCTDHYECPDESFCSKTEGRSQGVCVAATIGSACSTSNQCPPTAYCQRGSGAVEGSCQPRLAMGASCDPNQQDVCLSPTVCRNGACLPLGEPGEACSDLGTCKFFTECIGGTCQPVGLLGQPCWIFGVCFEGTCDDATATCVAPKNAGDACGDDEECASGVCDGTCQACN
ncbi:MAG: hypothetical protein IRZ16_03305 [Myxococcaceae bacterium]|nr:hypothetical protein [Myxococcaceae bacterium]